MSIVSSITENTTGDNMQNTYTTGECMVSIIIQCRCVYSVCLHFYLEQNHPQFKPTTICKLKKGACNSVQFKLLENARTILNRSIYFHFKEVMKQKLKFTRLVFGCKSGNR